MNILFIHGYNSDSNSGTGQQVKNFFKDDNVIIPDFNLFDVSGTVEKIGEYVKQNKIQLIVGHSLGGFYTLLYPSNIEKIVINPCMYPSVEIPKLKPRPDHPEDAGEAPAETVEDWKCREEVMYNHFDMEDKGTVRGIFGKDDPLFSYREKFQKVYGIDYTLLTEGEHKLSDQQIEVALKAVREMKYIGGSCQPYAFPGDDL